MKNDVSAIPAGKSNYLKRLLFLLVCVLMLGNAVWAQQPTITIHAKNQSLKEVLKEIEQQSKHSFIYSSSTINVNQKVNLECNGVSLDKALEQLGAIADITYSISNHQIMLAPAGKQPTPAAVAGNQKGAKAGQTIRGVVKDENGDPIVGASVFFKGTTVGVATDVDGKFTLKTTEAGQLLVASFIGYSNAEVKVMPNQEVYNFDLKPESKMIEEVIVTGYQTISKERATGSFAIISPKDMEGKLQTNVMDRLEGKVAGLTQIPGKAPQIRGISSLRATKTPLYVVDGVPFEGTGNTSDANPLDVINPADIVNITVLKDATAASIYGARSANGVIVITTRNGATGPTRVNYNGSIKFTPLPDRGYMNLMSSSELVDFQVAMYDAYYGDGTKPDDLDERQYTNEVYYLLNQRHKGLISDTDLNTQLEKYRNQDRYSQVKKEFLRKAAMVHQHNLSFSGGSDIYKYTFSVNYQGDAPYEKEEYTQRIGYNLKNTFDFFKWLQVNVGVLGSNVTKDYDNGVTGYNYLNGGGPSYRMLRDENGNATQWYSSKSQFEIDRLNGLGLQDETFRPVEEMNTRHYNFKSNYLNLNLGVNLKIIEGLNLDLRYQTERTNEYSKQYDTKDALVVKTMINDAAQIEKSGNIVYNIPTGGQMVETKREDNSYTLRAQLNFHRTFNDLHDIQVLAGGERRMVKSESSGIYRLGYDDYSLSWKNINEQELGQTINGTESLYGNFSFNNKTPVFKSREDRYVSFYGNASYTFNQKITATGSIRIDQSNLFGTDPKYQYRPLWSAGLQYVISDHQLTWLDRLVIRGTYGINGNIAKDVGPYMISKTQSNANYYTNESFAYITSPPNSGLRWEKTKVINLGLDFNLWNNRLNGSVDFYNKQTSDLLGYLAADATLGWSQLMVNYGSMNNRGIEIALNSENIRTDDFSWHSNFVFSYNRNKLTNIENSANSVSDYTNGLQNREGHPMNSLYSVRFAGLDENGHPTAYKKDGTIVKGTDELDKDDLVYSGTYTPPYNASLTNSLSYKGLSLSFMFVMYAGHVMRDVAASYSLSKYPILNYASNMDRGYLNYWKSPEDSNNPDINPAYIKNASTTITNLWAAADKHIQKGNYIKLRDITLSYRIPRGMLKKCFIQDAMVSLQIQNLWYWAANDKNLDPEVWSGSSLAPSRGTHYPATYTLGLSLNF